MNANWLCPSTFPVLCEGTVDIWRAPLTASAAEFEQLKSNLSEHDKARAHRFVFERDRDAFTCARGILRELLGRYLGCRPYTIEFEYGDYGKPILAGRHTGDPIQFNLSHSRGVAIYGFAVNRKIGVDVELVRQEPRRDEIAERYFSRRETEELRHSSEDQRTEMFFLCWTRKEAYVKATGLGMKIPLQSFDVSLSPGNPVTLALSAEADSTWRIVSLEWVWQGNNRYVSAVVAEGLAWKTRLLDWHPSWHFNE
jgi:4'-phosphopantetheinyl transferase